VTALRDGKCGRVSHSLVGGPKYLVLSAKASDPLPASDRQKLRSRAIGRDSGCSTVNHPGVQRPSVPLINTAILHDRDGFNDRAAYLLTVSWQSRGRYCDFCSSVPYFIKEATFRVL
jgi:hypothetical protein